MTILEVESNRFMSVCVCSLNHSACNAHMRPIILSSVDPPSVQHFSTLSDKQCGETLLNITCVSWFSTHLPEIFPILRKIQREMIKKMYIGRHVKYTLFLTGFNKTWNFPMDFRKLLAYKISWKYVRGELSFSMREYGRTDRQTWRS